MFYISHTNLCIKVQSNELIYLLTEALQVTCLTGQWRKRRKWSRAIARQGNFLELAFVRNGKYTLPGYTHHVTGICHILGEGRTQFGCNSSLKKREKASHICRLLWMITSRETQIPCKCFGLCSVAFSAPGGSGQLRADVTLKQPTPRDVWG